MPARQQRRRRAPRVRGIVPGRNNVGDEWCQLHVVAAGAASNRGTKRAVCMTHFHYGAEFFGVP